MGQHKIANALSKRPNPASVKREVGIIFCYSCYSKTQDQYAQSRKQFRKIGDYYFCTDCVKRGKRQMSKEWSSSR